MKRLHLKDRYLYYIQKKINTTLHGATPAAVKGRFIGPRILLNSIPKSGTHLLERVLENIPLLRHSGRRTLIAWDHITQQDLNRVRHIRRGMYLLAHLPAHPKLLVLLEQEKTIKTLVMLRDPRDIVVSTFKYLTYIDVSHTMHPHFAALADDDARLMAAIHGLEGVIDSIQGILSKFAPWLKQSNILPVRFEQLVGAAGGGEAGQQLTILQQIADYLEVNLDPAAISRIAANLFSEQSLTFRKGKIGSWRETFKPEHIAAFKACAGEWLIEYGYEQDLTW